MMFPECVLSLRAKERRSNLSSAPVYWEIRRSYEKVSPILSLSMEKIKVMKARN